MNPKSLGNLGEDIACDYLKEKGYKILERNFKIKTKFGRLFGEIDIIAKPKRSIFDLITGKKDEAIHFVEVKVIRDNRNFEAEDRVDFKKQRKLVKLAQIWLTKNKIPLNTKWQIDVIGIKIDPEAKNVLHQNFGKKQVPHKTGGFGAVRTKIKHFENIVSE